MHPKPSNPPAMRRLCICADDYGLATGINHAVMALIDRGVVTATSCMVTRLAWPSGARLLRELPQGTADLGLHLDLTCLPATASEARLAPLVLRSMTRRLDPDTLRAQIDQQLDRFEQAVGRPPDHVDGHRHVHQLPVVRDALINAITQRYPGPRPWLRSTRMEPRALPSPLKHRLIRALGGRTLDRQAKLHGIPLSHRLLGVYDFDPGRDHFRHLLSLWLRHCQDGDVLMCHPSTTRIPGDAIAPARVQEFAALASLQQGAATADGWVDFAPLSPHVPRPSFTA